jgi:predicted GIY-YIG superfamily endonuclease
MGPCTSARRTICGGASLNTRPTTCPGFTAKYGVTQLVYYEGFETRDEARLRERHMKKWNRAWKLALIERFNPGWRDLFETEAL